MPEDKSYTELNPASFDPTTGLNTYKISSPQGPKELKLWSAGNFFQQNRDVRFDANQSDALKRRLEKLYMHFGQDNLDQQFALDAAFSPMSDDEMVRLAKYRMGLNESQNKAWWQKAWHYTLGAPVGAVFSGLDWVYDNSMNAIARTVTNDDKATFHGLIGIGVMTGVGLLQGKSVEDIRDEHGYDASTHTFLDKDTGEHMDMTQWMETKAPGWVKAADFGGYLIDPFIALSALRTARLGARVVRAGEVAAEAGRAERAFGGIRAFAKAREEGEGLWAAYKSLKEAREVRSIESFARRPGKVWGMRPDDVSRILEGKLTWMDYFKGENLRDILRAQRGTLTSTQRAIQQVAGTGGNFSAIKSILKGMTGKEPPIGTVGHFAEMVRSGEAAGHSTAEIVNTINDHVESLFDYARHDELKGTITAAEKKASGVQKELEDMVKSFYDSMDFDPGLTLGEEPTAWAQRNLKGKAKESFQRKVEEVAAANGDVDKLKFEMSSLAFMDRMPRVGAGYKLNRYLERAAGSIEDAYEAPTAKSILASVGKPLARTLRGVVQMNPHTAIAVSEDYAHVQVKRWLDEAFHVTNKTRPVTGVARKGAEKLPVVGKKIEGAARVPTAVPFTDADVEHYYSKFIKAKDDLERKDIVRESTEHFVRSLGFNDEEIDLITQKYRDVWGGNLRAMTNTSPDELTPLMDPHLMRQLARYGPEGFKSKEELVKKIGLAAEKLQRGWKTMAVLRPAWAARVVLFSEQPRLAMAGLPNLMTHPLIAVALSEVPGASKAARTMLGIRMKIPVLRSRAMMNYEVLDDLLKSTHGGTMLMKSEKRRRALGNLASSFGVNTVDRMRWDELLSHADKKNYKKGWLKVLNEWLPDDPLHSQFRQGADLRSAIGWANGPDASVWRAKNGVKAGSPELQRAVKTEKNFYDSVTLGDSEIAKNMGNLKLADLGDVNPPAELPITAWSGSLDRPGMSMDKVMVDKLMGGVWKMFSSEPSYWLSRHGPARFAFADELVRRSKLYTAPREALAGAKEVELPKLAGSPDARRALQDVRDTMRPHERPLWDEYVSQRMSAQGPQVRDKLVSELAHNVDNREAVRAFLDEMSDSDELVVFRGHKGKLWEPLTDSGNASLDFRVAQGFAGQSGTVTELRIKKSDVLGIGAAGEHEVLFWQRDAHVPGMAPASAKPDIKKMFAAHAGKSVSLTGAEQKIVDDAWAAASFKVRQAVYDLSESSRAADLARFVAPFGNAWQEELTRWAMLTFQRPLIPAVIGDMWHNKHAAPFSYTDPRTGEEMFFLPWSDKLVKFATGGFNPITGADNGVAMPLTGRWKNINILTGNSFLPGFGPYTVMASKALDKLGILPTSIGNAIDPYGSSWKDVVMPSAFMREYRDLSERDRSVTHAKLFNSVLANAWERTGGRLTEDDIEKAENQFSALKVINAAAGIFVGSGIKAELPSKMQQMAEFYKWAATSFPDVADDLFLGEHGDDAAAFMVHYTRSLTGAPPTKEAEQFLMAPGMKQWNNHAFWSVMSERARGDFDPVAYTAQIERGDREVRTGREFVKAANTYVGWYRYGQLKSQYRQTLAALGINPRSDKAAPYKAIFDSKAQVIFDTYPGFQAELETSVNTEWKQNQRDLFQLIHQPFADGLQGTLGARAYFNEVRSVVYGLRQAGLKSLNSQKAKNFAKMHAANMEAIFRRYPEFRVVYDRLGLDNFSAMDGEWPNELFSGGEL